MRSEMKGLRGSFLRRACAWVAPLAVGLSIVTAGELGQAQGNGVQPVSGRGMRQEFSLTLNRGDQQVLSAQGVKNYSEGTEGIIDVRLTGDAARFVVVGKTPGTTTLLFLMTDGSERVYQVTVVDPFATPDTPAPAGEDPLAVKPKANIRLDLYFVQLDRTSSTAAGMNMPTSFGTGQFNYGYDLTARMLVSNTAVVSSEILPTLDLAQSQGWAKINRHVALITTNGTEANFDSGGEFNVAVSQGLTATVQSISFGTVLGVTPRYDDTTHRMEMTVSATISDLAATAASIPGRNRSILSTVVNLALGESLAVAGLTSNTQEDQKTGVPGLSQIPILGYLFGKRSQKKTKTENLVFVVPSVVEPMQRTRAREFIDGALREYDNYTGKMPAHSLMPTMEQTSAKGANDASPATR